MRKELTTYQIYLILLGYLTEHDDSAIVEPMLIELYKRAENEKERMKEKLPAAAPAEKMEHWVDNGCGDIFCSKCGSDVLYEKVCDEVYPRGSSFERVMRVKSAFCPSCGAKMIEPEESEE